MALGAVPSHAGKVGDFYASHILYLCDFCVQTIISDNFLKLFLTKGLQSKDYSTWA